MARERISLKGISREMRRVARKLRAARRHAEKGERATLESLMKQLQNLESRTADMCGRTYGVWPPPLAPAKPSKPSRPAPSKPATRKPARKRPARPARKKGGR
jgi:hypothetical protein